MNTTHPHYVGEPSRCYYRVDAHRLYAIIRAKSVDRVLIVERLPRGHARFAHGWSFQKSLDWHDTRDVSSTVELDARALRRIISRAAGQNLETIDGLTQSAEDLWLRDALIDYHDAASDSEVHGSYVATISFDRKRDKYISSDNERVETAPPAMR